MVKKSPDEMSPKEQREFLHEGGTFVLPQRDLLIFALPEYGRYLLLNRSAGSAGGGDAIVYRLGHVIDLMEQYAPTGSLEEWQAVAGEASSAGN